VVAVVHGMLATALPGHQEPGADNDDRRPAKRVRHGVIQTLNAKAISGHARARSLSASERDAAFLKDRSRPCPSGGSG
jgi:hypothetical protein